MMSDGKNIEAFWQYYSGGAKHPRLTCEERLFELNLPFFVSRCDRQIRLAEPRELERVAAAHAEIAQEESGVNPLETDREGFVARAPQNRKAEPLSCLTARNSFSKQKSRRKPKT